jgi:glycosyltransferase involved in cell wall biosynthesis
MAEIRNKPDISIITATHHRPDLLRRSILSLKNQNHANYEHIVVSDHCPYARYVYEEFSDDSRIRFFENQYPWIKNAGSIAKNIGIENIRSDLIGYCDDDNVLLPNCIETFVDKFSNNQSLEVLFTQAYFIKVGIGNNQIEKIVKRDLEDYSDHTEIIWHDNLCMAHTRSAIENVGPWRTDNPGIRDGEDDELIRRFFSNNLNIKKIEEKTGIYYWRSACVENDNAYHQALTSLNVDSGNYYVFNYQEGNKND